MAYEINVDSRLLNSPLRRKPNVLIGQKPRSTDLSLLESYTSCTDPRLPGALLDREAAGGMEGAARDAVQPKADTGLSLHMQFCTFVMLIRASLMRQTELDDFVCAIFATSSL